MACVFTIERIEEEEVDYDCPCEKCNLNYRGWDENDRRLHIKAEVERRKNGRIAALEARLNELHVQDERLSARLEEIECKLKAFEAPNLLERFYNDENVAVCCSKDK